MNGEKVGDAFIEFIRELSIKCKNNGVVLSVDNYVPMSHTSFYNRKEQANFADYVVIMGYDEHYAGSPEAGSVASLSWVTQGVSDTLKRGSCRSGNSWNAILYACMGNPIREQFR